MTLAIGAVSAVILAFVLIAKRRGWELKAGEGQVSTPVAVVILVAMGAIVFGALARDQRDPSEIAAANRLTLPASARKLASLAAGTQFPAVEPVGRLNDGSAPGRRSPARIRVVDVWSSWCPMVERMAPALVRLQSRYASQGVDFIGITDDSKETTVRFVERFKIGWRTDYGVTKAEMAGLGVVPPVDPGAESRVAPTLYLLGPGGKVLWNDGAGRFNHKDTDANLAELAREIDKALGLPQTAAKGRDQARSSS